jgi:hypothetical protein
MCDIQYHDIQIRLRENRSTGSKLKVRSHSDNTVVSKAYALSTKMKLKIWLKFQTEVLWSSDQCDITAQCLVAAPHLLHKRK